MADFLEERIDNQKIKMSSSFAEEYAVNVVQTAGGQEYRSLVHQFPRRTFDISQMLSKPDTYSYIMALYHRAHGQYAGFRIKCYDEYSSNGATGTPTEIDQLCLKISTTIWQLRKFYGTNGTSGATGYPYRKIFKPVSGTVKVAVNGTLVSGPGANWTVDTTTGRVTLSAGVAATVVADNVTAGFMFDFPVRFSGSLVVSQDHVAHRNVDGISLVELLNP